MSIKLPPPVASYFAAENADNPDGLTACFSDDAVVRDEGRTMRGMAAIKAWAIETKAKYQHTIEVLASSETDGETLVRGRVSGNFPGSPVELEFAFLLAGGKITSLEIHL